MAASVDSLEQEIETVNWPKHSARILTCFCNHLCSVFQVASSHLKGLMKNFLLIEGVNNMVVVVLELLRVCHFVCQNYSKKVSTLDIFALS